MKVIVDAAEKVKSVLGGFSGREKLIGQVVADQISKSMLNNLAIANKSMQKKPQPLAFPFSRKPSCHTLNLSKTSLNTYHYLVLRVLLSRQIVIS